MPDTENSIQNEGLPEVTLQIVASPSQTASMTVAASNTVQAPVDATLTISGKAADAKVTGTRLSAVEANANAKVNKPTENPDGTAGQVLKTNGNGTTEWIDPSAPTDSQAAASISAWLNDHPEATTTVEDGAISGEKLSERLKNDIKKAVMVEEDTSGIILRNIEITENSITIETQPVTVQASIGDTVTYTVEAYAYDDDGAEISSDDLNYQWKAYSKDNGWQSTGTNSKTLSFTAAANSGTRYQCTISNPYNGDVKTTNVVYLLIEEPISNDPIDNDPIEDPNI